jgi:predicted lysophospholipase L1 biosynthesis ABC-type transport system permease subunit
VLGDGAVVGRRVRYAGSGDDEAPSAWYEIVGVVADFPASAMEPGAAEARLYHPVRPLQVPFNLVALRVQQTPPANFSSRLREVATALDPRLQVRELLPLDDALREEQVELRLAAWSIGLVTLSVLLLSAAGIYALVSFTVAQRRREIGIRIALGANPRRLLASIFSQAARQIALGVVAGVLVAGLIDRMTAGELTGGAGLALLPVVAAFMLLVGLVAAAVPARRGLRIQPTEALREE